MYPSLVAQNHIDDIDDPTGLWQIGMELYEQMKNVLEWRGIYSEQEKFDQQMFSEAGKLTKKLLEKHQNLIQAAKDYGIHVENKQWIDNHFWQTPVLQMCTRIFPEGSCNYQLGMYGDETPIKLLEKMAYHMSR